MQNEEVRGIECTVASVAAAAGPLLPTQPPPVVSWSCRAGGRRSGEGMPAYGHRANSPGIIHALRVGTTRAPYSRSAIFGEIRSNSVIFVHSGKKFMKTGACVRAIFLTQRPRRPQRVWTAKFPKIHKLSQSFPRFPNTFEKNARAARATRSGRYNPAEVAWARGWQNEAKMGRRTGPQRAGWICKMPLFTGQCDVSAGFEAQGRVPGKITERSHLPLPKLRHERSIFVGLRRDRPAGWKATPPTKRDGPPNKDRGKMHPSPISGRL
jgi:hypothetical protein